MEKLNNIQNLDSILFYSGPDAVVAAEYTEGREFGSYVNRLGYLRKNADSSIYFSEYPNVKYKERVTTFDKMNDLYSETLSYLVSNTENVIGNSYITNNRYNVIYTYETDLNNNFDNARNCVKTNLSDFLIALNTQKYNKEAKYGDNFEVSSIKIDQTYFRWYPENTIAYYNTETTETPYTYTYYFINDNPVNKYEGEENEQLTAYLNERGGLADGEFIHSYSYTDTIITSEDIPYIIGGNYYSYVKQSYATIDYKLEEKIDNKLSDFEEKYNHNASIYAYYMYDCNSDIKMLLTTLSLGVKESTFKIGFDSKFNKWFDNVINLHAELNENDVIANITSADNNEIFSIFRNNIDRITGNNVELNKDELHSFVTNSAVTLEDTINILTPYSIDTLDLSPIKTKISNILDLNETGWITDGSNMKKLILDDGTDTPSNIEKIFGLNDITSLEYIDMSNLSNLTRTPAIDALENLKVFKANNSNIDSFRPKKGTTLYNVELPESVKSIKLIDNTFEEGTLTVLGQQVHFDGNFNYTPNVNLTNLTLRNIDNELSYKLVTDWYDAIEAADKLDSVIYLELNNIEWNNVSANTLINLKHFDINPNLSGEISIYGSGNYHKLTRSEYQDIVKGYGINAFVHGDVSNKVFKDLDISLEKSKETFEYSLKVLNKSIEAYNASFDEDSDNIRYKDTLAVEFKGYAYDVNNGHREYEIDPYTNRAANALLDIIYKANQDFIFIKDDIDNYAYCKLDSSIDTSASNEVKNIKAGDIMLFNSDTLMIFFEDVNNSIYEYIKLGNIIDETVEDYYGRAYSSLKHWFDHNNAATLRFIPSEREKVVDNLSLSVSDLDIHENENDNDIRLTITLPVNVITAIENNEIEDTNIIVTSNDNCVTLEKISDYEYRLHITYDFIASKNVILSAYVEGHEADTNVSITVKLNSEIESSYLNGDIIVLNSTDSYLDAENRTLVLSPKHELVYDADNLTLIIK